jgi:hypothetical protein
MSIEIHDGDGPASVAQEWVIGEGDQLSIRRYPNVRYLPRRFVQRLSHRIFEAFLATDEANYREL